MAKNSQIRDLLKRAIEQKQQRMEDEDFSRFSQSIAKEIGDMVSPEAVSNKIVDSLTASLAPIIQTLLERDRASAADIERVISQIKLPEIRIPDIRIPDIPAPRVNVSVPPIKIPEIRMPEEMDIRGWVNMMLDDKPVSLGNPLPVTLRDADGAPLDILGNLSTIVGGSSGGGKRDYFTIKDIRASSASLIDQVEGALKVTGDLSATLSADTGSGEIGSNTLRIVSATDSVTSVNIVSGSSAGTQYADGATAEPATGTLAMGDTGEESGNIFALHTHSGVVGSGVMRVVHATDVGLSTNVTNTVTVQGTLTSTGAYLLNGDGAYRGTLPVEGTVLVSDITASVKTALIDSTGVQYSGSNPVPVTATVSGSISSTVAVGDIPADGADTGSAPLKIGGIARQANPTAVAAGDRVSATYDDVGRQVFMPINVRDLRMTAYTSLTNGTETSLLAGASGELHDLVWVMGANQSDVAVLIDLRASTGGTVIMSLEIPANGTAGIAPPMPYPQPFSNAAWTADMGDITGTTVDITALFSKEV